MIHIVRLLQRRFPERSGQIIGWLVLISLAALAVGVGVLLSR